jgi:hypothetical protein
MYLGTNYTNRGIKSLPEKYGIGIILSVLILHFTLFGYSQNNQFFVNGVLQSEKINLSTPETEWIKGVTKRFSPVSWYLLEQYEQLPEDVSSNHVMGGLIAASKSISTFFFLRGNNKMEQLFSMQTNVHEIVHAYFTYAIFKYANENNLALNSDKIEGYIYLTPEHQYFISFYKEAFFPSNELIPEIPDELRTFRFDTYIDGFTSTQDLGVIGLLNEFNAYYIGSQFSYDMLEAYKIASENRVNAFLQWVEHCQSTMSAYYEFEFYIREYLLYMKHEYPDNYALLLHYKPFTEAYFATRSLYRELLSKYQQRIMAELQILNRIENSLARIDGTTLWIRTELGGELGTSILSKDITVLKPILESNRYRSIAGDYPEK